jgi:hypothetical protein
MPCGGITPTKNSFLRDTVASPQECYYCGKKGALHFVEEWDAFIHAVCVPAFLQTDEGKVIIKHKHEVYIDFELEELEDIAH